MYGDTVSAATEEGPPSPVSSRAFWRWWSTWILPIPGCADWFIATRPRTCSPNQTPRSRTGGWPTGRSRYIGCSTSAERNSSTIYIVLYCIPQRWSSVCVFALQMSAFVAISRFSLLTEWYLLYATLHWLAVLLLLVVLVQLCKCSVYDCKLMTLYRTVYFE